MSNPSKGKVSLTTDLVDAYKDNSKDLFGFVLNQQDINTVLIKIFAILGISESDIRPPRIGVNQYNQPRIYVDVKKKALEIKEEKVDENDSWLSFTSNYNMNNDYDDNHREAKIDKTIFSTLLNKTFWKQMDPPPTYHTKRYEGEKVKYVELSFDLDVLVAFAYNINYKDPFYNIIPQPIDWYSNQELDKMIKTKEMSKKEANYHRKQRDFYLEKRLRKATFFVFGSITKESKEAFYDKIEDAIKKGTYNKLLFEDDVNNILLSNGKFHPQQVEEFRKDDEKKGYNSDKR